MHIVEVRHRNADLAAAMAQMRTWLDDQQMQPALFEIDFLPGRELRFRLQFKKLSDAVTFANSFHGEVLDADPVLQLRDGSLGYKCQPPFRYIINTADPAYHAEVARLGQEHGVTVQ